jgi:Tfp pilus assembly protein PilO
MHIDFKWLAARRWVVITGLAMALFAYAVVSEVIPLSMDLLHVHRATMENQQRISEAETWQSHGAAIKRKREKMKSEMAQLVFSRGRDSQVSKILAILSQTAQEREINILALKPQAIKTYQRHVELPIQLEVTGHFHALGRFTNALETAATVIKLEGLKIVSKEMASEFLHAQMTVVVYYVTPAVSSSEPTSER